MCLTTREQIVESESFLTSEEMPTPPHHPNVALLVVLTHYIEGVIRLPGSTLYTHILTILQLSHKKVTS